MRRLEAISASAVGSQRVWMGQTQVAPRTASGDHHHGDSETAIYVVSGHPVFVFAEDGEEVRLETSPGDYVFVPPFTPHREENPTDPTPSSSSPAAARRRSSSTCPGSPGADGRPRRRRRLGLGADRPLLPTLDPARAATARRAARRGRRVRAGPGRRHRDRHPRAGGADAEAQPEDRPAVDVPALDAVVRQREPAGVPGAPAPAEDGETGERRRPSRWPSSGRCRGPAAAGRRGSCRSRPARSRSAGTRRRARHRAPTSARRGSQQRRR